MSSYMESKVSHYRAAKAQKSLCKCSQTLQCLRCAHTRSVNRDKEPDQILDHELRWKQHFEFFKAAFAHLRYIVRIKFLCIAKCYMEQVGNW